ncbi:hypothetical protein DT019_29195 [Streptomyces sp. SDr-06]|uniref:hypothetical protein n=1 Tax=Streptomyces sp. SDr-06 TaxID=2267702 RepID=UPI000DE8A3FC|nr:hypothetical protein [Streptomyces sp. SDr-06]RCH65247.1 hypothetical protein DT019_29195 [Streptomyces sp. SDr-06]
MSDRPDTGTEEKKRIDLSVPQVAGSALAAVTAAVLASQLGVYGTFLGAGVVSVVATCGGTIFQHFFKRTGEQLREVTVQAKIGSRQVPVISPYKGRADETTEPPGPDADRTQLLGRVDPDSTQLLGRVDPDRTQLIGPADADRTQLLKSVDGTQLLPSGAGAAREFNEATVHGTRLRGWKRPLLAAAVVFGVSMGGITAYELISGGEVGGNGGGTTLTSVLTGGSERKDPPAPSDPGGRHTPSPGTGGSSDPGTGEGGTTGGHSSTKGPSPSASPSKSADPGSDSGSGSGSGGTTPTPTPTPSGSKSSGSGDAGSAGSSGSGSGGRSTPDGRSGATPAP